MQKRFLHCLYSTTSYLLISTVSLEHMMKSFFALAEVVTVLVQYCFNKYISYKEKMQLVHY